MLADTDEEIVIRLKVGLQVSIQVTLIKYK